MKGKLLEALELEKKGDWNGAHKIVQDMGHRMAYWIHAYLHRKEPDPDNAAYWYYRAERPVPKISFEEEWKEIHDFISKNYIS